MRVDGGSREVGDGGWGASCRLVSASSDMSILEPNSADLFLVS